MSTDFVDFKVIKEQVSMQAVLDHYSIHLRRVNQTGLRGKCPLPAHSSETSKESFSVQVVKNIWACQSQSCASKRKGKRGGNVLDFVASMEGCTVREAAQKLQGWFLTSAPAPAPTGMVSRETQLVSERKEGREETQVNKPLSFTLQGIDCTHPYLRQRGIREETAEHFGVGFFPGRGVMSGRVVIPIRNERGELVAYAGRAVDGSQPKYKVPAGFHKGGVLFNLNEALKLPASSDLVVVEGFFDAMKVYQAGFPAVVALMGCLLSNDQQKLLGGISSVWC